MNMMRPACGGRLTHVEEQYPVRRTKNRPFSVEKTPTFLLSVQELPAVPSYFRTYNRPVRKMSILIDLNVLLYVQEVVTQFI